MTQFGDKGLPQWQVEKVSQTARYPLYTMQNPPLQRLNLNPDVSHSFRKTNPIIIFYQRQGVLSRGIEQVSGCRQGQFFVMVKVLLQNLLAGLNGLSGKYHVLTDFYQLAAF